MIPEIKAKKPALVFWKAEIMKRNKRTNESGTQLIVPCPRRIQKAMIKSLLASAKSRINPTRAKKSAEILAAIKQPVNSI